MKCVIIDDEPHARALLRNLLTEGKFGLHIVGEASDVDSAIEIISFEKPDIVFLDIRIKDRLGFEVLDRFPEPDFKIVFTTAFDEYALEAFEYAAVHYLLKPYDLKALRKAIDRCINSVHQQIDRDGMLKHLNTNQTAVVVIPNRSGTLRYPVKEVMYLIGAGAYTEIYLTEGRTVLASKALGHFQKSMNDTSIFRCHKKHMVNIDHIRKFEKGAQASVVMSDGKYLEVSRTYKSDLTHRLRPD